MKKLIGKYCCEYLTTRSGKLVFNIQDCEYLTNRCEAGINKQDYVSRLSEHELL